MLPNFSRAALCANVKGKSLLFRLVFRSKKAVRVPPGNVKRNVITAFSYLPARLFSHLDLTVSQILMLTIGFIDHSFEKGLPAK
jgi:hypothetical protein